MSHPLPILLIALALLAHASGDASTGKLWVSPDERFAAAFPAEPEKINAQLSGGSGAGYKAIVRTPSGFLQCVVTSMEAQGVRSRPPEAQVREILQMSTDAFVASARLARTTGNVITVDGGNVSAMMR